MDFYSAYAHGFARIAACTLPVAIADPATNARRILEQARACHEDGVAVAVFPELSMTGYSIDDLFLQDRLLEAVEAGLADLAAGTTDLRPLLLVGAPLVHGTRVVNYARWESPDAFHAMLDNPDAQVHIRTAAAIADEFDPHLYTVESVHHVAPSQ